MKIFVIGRCLPESKTGLVGEFEFTQAQELAKHDMNISYLFCDTRSIKSLHRLGKRQLFIGNMPVFGTYFPIGGLPAGPYNKLRFELFKHLWRTAVSKQGIPDIVHFHFPLITANRDIIDFIKMQGVRIVITEHWSKVLFKHLRVSWLETHKYMMDTVDTVLAVSSPLKRSMLELAGKKRQVYVVPNMVNSEFCFKQKKVVNHRFEFIAVGRIVSVKNFDFLIRSFVHAFKLDKNVQLTIVGDGPKLSYMKRLIKRLNAIKVIKLKGFMDNIEVAEYMKHCDALVSASSVETFGVPWIEAWSCGLPVIGIYNNSINEYFNKGNSLNFKDKDMNDLARVLKKMVDRKNDYDHLHIAQTAAKIFSGPAVAKKLLLIYKDLLY